MAEDPGSLREALRQEFIGSVFGSAPAQPWRTLVVDYHAMRILSSAVTMYDVLDHGFDIVDSLEDDSRLSAPEKICLYLVSPSEVSVEMIIRDFSPGAPKYGRAEVFFTAGLPEKLLQRLAQSSAAPFVSVLKELNLEYLAPESRVFHFDSPETFRMIYSPSLSDLRDPALDELASKISFFLSSSNSAPNMIRYPPSLERVSKGVASSLSSLDMHDGGEKTVLLLVDRLSDLTAPIMHEFSYQAMAADLAGKQLQGESIRSSSSDSAEKPIVLDERDSIFAQIRHLFISEASEFIVLASKKFAQEYNVGSGSKIPEDLKEMKDFIRSISRKQELASKYSMHADLIHKLTEEFKSRDLQTISMLEQDITRGETVLGKGVKFDQVWAEVQKILKDKPDGEKRKDVLRLLALVATMDGFKEDHVDALVNPAQLWPEETAALLNFMRLAPKKAKSSVFSNLFTSKKSTAKAEVSYDLARYVPPLKNLVNDLVEGKLSERDYPRLVLSSTSPTPGARSKAAWAKKTASGEPASSPKMRKGPRYVVFVVGGVAYNEIRIVYELSSLLKTDIVIGSTHIIDPNQFVRDMRL
eukprot:TRINITY_DN1925_c0_g1_i1.p1 TRINITY_DN1925_c0_g1~~TRINITY_DN1925_c0_g1_i1.p1  ORF type:complete len:584 (+),score=80.04 TRINITY_DN1925_c0_g1_i1:81-1832(+)